jgi:hypothetical protein
MVTDDVGNADRNPPITDSARVSTFPFPLILRSIGTRSTPDWRVPDPGEALDPS